MLRIDRLGSRIDYIFNMYKKNETQRNFDRKFVKLFAGAVVLSAVAIAVANEYDEAHPKPTVRFTNEFTDKGKCLHDTPYDPSNGAQSLTRHFDEVDSLTIIPDFANSPTPPVLYLSVEGGQIHPRDHQTESILVKSGCINATKA